MSSEFGDRESGLHTHTIPQNADGWGGTFLTVDLCSWFGTFIIYKLSPQRTPPVIEKDQNFLLVGCVEHSNQIGLILYLRNRQTDSRVFERTTQADQTVGRPNGRPRQTRQRFFTQLLRRSDVGLMFSNRIEADTRWTVKTCRFECTTLNFARHECVMHVLCSRQDPFENRGASVVTTRNSIPAKDSGIDSFLFKQNTTTAKK